VTLADLKIRTKDKRLIALTPNEVQERYLDMLQERHPEFEWRKGVYTLRGAREDILKARQHGFSTLVLALFFLDTINTPHTASICLTDNGQRSETLFRIIHRFYDNLPPDKKRPKKYSSKKEIEFSDIDSIIAVGTAGTGNVGRGGTVQNAHLSERAFWDNGAEVETGLLESVPDSGNVVRETTANGYNEYYQERQREHNGESVFMPRFFGWHQHREYRRTLVEGVTFVRTAEEQQLASIYGLDDEQLNWRRWKVKTLKEKFSQEYPINPAEAFLASGNPYFDRERLTRLMEEAREILPLRRLVWSPAQFPLLREAYRQPLREVEGVDAATMQLTVYEPPLAGHRYIVTCDPAQGLNDRGDRDYCSTDVFDAESWTQSAHLHGRFEPHIMGQLLAELGAAYNMALVAVLQNNHGHAVLNELLRHPHLCLDGRPYPRQWGRSCTGVFYFDPHFVFNEARTGNPQTLQPGYPENARTKPRMLDALADALATEPGIGLRYPRTLSEMMSYIHLEGGGSGGEAGCHDDCVASAALAALLLALRWERGRTSVPEHDRPSAGSGKGRP
jgi:hypothetical protein